MRKNQQCIYFLFVIHFLGNYQINNSFHFKSIKCWMFEYRFEFIFQFVVDFLNCINILHMQYCCAMIMQMMKQRHKVEKEQNIGDEIGWSKNQEAAKSNPKLAAMNKKFGMIHGLSSLANIMSFGSLAMHSWYLAGKLNL